MDAHEAAMQKKAAEVFAAARKASQRSVPRQHHLVPAFYLRRWAENDKVRVTEIEPRRSYVTNPKRAAREADFYSLASEHLDPDEIPPLLYETMLGDLEGTAKRVITELSTFPTRLAVDDRFYFSMFMAFQLTRGAAFREEVQFLSNEWFKHTWTGLNDDGIRAELHRRGEAGTDEQVRSSRELFDGIRDGSITTSPARPVLTSQSGETAVELVQYLAFRSWSVYETRAILITSDEPVIPLGGPGNPRDERGGVATAAKVLFPLGPGLLLVMDRPDLAAAHGIKDQLAIGHDRLDHNETVDVCREIGATAHRWLFERPSKQLGLRLPLPANPPVSALEAVGSGTAATGEQGTLMRHYKPNRWTNDPDPPAWPVAKWWT